MLPQVSVGGIIMLRDACEGDSPEELIEPIKGVYRTSLIRFHIAEGKRDLNS